ncbi:hypothetical protein F5Y08DRAFT_48615 [Xylaria arbuscula]|nr:hypothetical protein F5Y08DRAFT_48615 [Xylaria arbuscula]
MLHSELQMHPLLPSFFFFFLSSLLNDPLISASLLPVVSCPFTRPISNRENRALNAVKKESPNQLRKSSWKTSLRSPMHPSYKPHDVFFRLRVISLFLFVASFDTKRIGDSHRPAKKDVKPNQPGLESREMSGV